MICFGVWAPSQSVFWESWIAAGIATAPNRIAPQFDAWMQTTAGSWDGIVSRDGVAVPGWHCNVRVWGAVEQQFIAGLPQTGSLWERTHAALVFNLSDQAADPVTGFPAGMRSPHGVVYADAEDFSSPSNVWA